MIKYRNPVISDIPGIIDLEIKQWGETMAASSQKKWKSRIATYPEGTWIAEKNNTIVGVVVTVRLYHDFEKSYPSWNEITADGFITNHDYSGNTMYGVDLSVNDKEELNISSQLLIFAIHIPKHNKSVKGYMGARIPSLKNFIQKNNVQKINQTLVGEVAKTDPLVNFFLQNGFKYHGVKKNYFPEDENSLGWGVILEVKKI